MYKNIQKTSAGQMEDGDNELKNVPVCGHDK